ncbi:MAG: radical SAM family heme chaperone HemW, partial [Alphaproteobacteria bacterium]|nr:radical SAM family heme chaperone HemW [Alphaproteobacteria bacterium]
MSAPLHLYVHWPWCKAKCPYCDFNSHAIPQSGLPDPLRQAYIAKIIEEIKWWCGQIAPQRPLQSIFFGGGTPSLMQPSDIQLILQAAKHLGRWQATTEVTLECNPTSVAEDLGARYFKEIHQVGVNRLSIGVQGLRDDWLHFLGRTHQATGALATLDAAQRVFARVNADVIYGLPGQDLPAWQALLQELAGRGLSHIAAYQLTVERNTAFWGQVRKGLWQPLEADAEADFFEATREILQGFGYENYEISNFAKADEACRHNLGVWRGEDYLGVGAGAHGRVTLGDGTRVATANRKLPEAYLRGTMTDFKHFISWEPLNPVRTIQETLFTGFRLAEGVDIIQLQKTYGNDAWEAAVKMTEFQEFSRLGWIQSLTTPHETRWQLT